MMPHIHILFEFLSLLVALIYYPYLKPGYMKWFLPYLAFIFLSELQVAYQIYLDANKPNVTFYYFISILEYIFYNYIFYHLLGNRVIKKIVLYLIIGVTLNFFLGFLFAANKQTYLLVSLAIAGFLLSAIAQVYIYLKFISDDETSTLLISEPGFWIAFGVSIFFSGTCIVFSLHDFILKNQLEIFGFKLYHFVPRILSVFLYSGISVSLILCKKRNKILLSPS